LLGDRAAAFHNFAGLDVSHDGPGDAQGVDAVMAVKAGVFGGDDGVLHGLGYLIERHGQPVFPADGSDGFPPGVEDDGGYGDIGQKQAAFGRTAWNEQECCQDGEEQPVFL